MGAVCGAKAPMQPVDSERIDPERVRALKRDRNAKVGAEQRRKQHSNSSTKARAKLGVAKPMERNVTEEHRRVPSNEKPSPLVADTVPVVAKPRVESLDPSEEGLSSEGPTVGASKEGPSSPILVPSREVLLLEIDRLMARVADLEHIQYEATKQEEEEQKGRDNLLYSGGSLAEGEGGDAPTEEDKMVSDASSDGGASEENWKVEHPKIVNKSARVFDDRGNRLYGMDAEIAVKLKKKRDPKHESRALQWVAQVTGVEVSTVHDSLKSGLTLCKLINTFFPDIIPDKHLHTKPHPLHERENIQLYISTCERVGVDRGDLFNVNDLYEKKDLPAVVQNIYAFADLVAFKKDTLHLPKLTIGGRPTSLRVRPCKSEPRLHAASVFDSNSPSDLLPRPRGKATPEWKRRQMERRHKSVSFRRGDEALALQPEVVNKSTAVFDARGNRLYGMDAEIAVKLKNKRDPEQEQRALDWIAQVTDDEVDTLHALKTGLTLCKLINTFFPDIISDKHIHEKPHPLHERENLKLYISACERVGVERGDLFNVSDLYDKNDFPAVVQNIFAFAELVAFKKETQHLPKLKRVDGRAPPKIDIFSDSPVSVQPTHHENGDEETSDDKGEILATKLDALKAQMEEQQRDEMEKLRVQMEEKHRAVLNQLKAELAEQRKAMEAKEGELRSQLEEQQCILNRKKEKLVAEEAATSVADLKAELAELRDLADEKSRDAQQAHKELAAQRQKLYELEELVSTAKAEAEAAAARMRKELLGELDRERLAIEKEREERQRERLEEAKLRREAVEAVETEKQLTIDDLTRKLQDLIEERERARERLLQSPPAPVGEIERFVARFRIVQFRTHFKAETNLHGTSILDVLPCMFRSTESAEDLCGKAFVLSSCLCLWALAYGSAVRKIMRFHGVMTSVKRDHGSDSIFITTASGEEYMLHSLPCMDSGYELIKGRFLELNPGVQADSSSEYTESWSDGESNSSSEGAYEDAQVYSEEADVDDDHDVLSILE